MLCYRCGSHVPDGSETCGSCGQRFDASVRGGKTGTFQRRKLSELESAGVKIGEVLAGRYEVRSIVGQGPVGSVLRALDKEVDVEIGLKLIAPRLLQSPDERAEFVKLLKQAKRLSHPNVVRIYEIGSLDDDAAPTQRPFFTMQLLDGLTLRRVIDLRREKNQLFSLREVEPIVAQVALALEHAKPFGPHGDLKPDNIVVLPDLLKVTDFGLAPAMPRAPFVAAQRARKADVYLSPELLAGRPIDARADVYSIGVILGEMLAGALPTASRVPELRATNPELPAGVEALYRRAVSANGESRFPTAGELAAELLALAETTAPPLPRPEGAAPPQLRAPSAPPSRGKAKPPPPPEPSGNFDVDTQVDEPPRKAVQKPAEMVPTPAPPRPPPEAEGKADRKKPEAAAPPGAPRQAETTKNARPPKGPARDAGAISPGAETPTKVRARPPPPPPPVDESRGRRWLLAVPVALLAVGAAVYGGRLALLSWQAQERARLEAQLQREMEDKLARAQAAQALAAADAGSADAGAVASSGSVADAGPKVAAAAVPIPAPKPVVAANLPVNPKPQAEDPVQHRPTAPPEERVPSCPTGMRYVHGGSFRLGTPASDDLGNFGDRPERRAAVRGYCIDLYEYPNRAGAKPLVSVSYAGATAACEGEGKRLCSEEEWERACKGPDNLRFPYGQAFSARTCGGGGKGGLVPAGTYTACKSGFGVFDMSGNAAEWTSTRFQSGASDRAVKGGSYQRPDYDLRCSARQNRQPSSRASDLGFRCCADVR
ncbi:MAG: protein kinase domain-containing protein [Myxococcales bacterium]